MEGWPGVGPVDVVVAEMVMLPCHVPKREEAEDCRLEGFGEKEEELFEKEGGFPTVLSRACVCPSRR